MSERKVTNEMRLHVQGGSSLGRPRGAMSEVQICGVPKLCAGEVASTP